MTQGTKAALFIAFLVIIVFFPIVLNRQTFFSAIPGLALNDGPYGFSGVRTPWTLDPAVYMWLEVPQTMYWFRELREGHFPFWNPFQGLGQPLSGTLFSGIYNPFKFTLFVLFPYLKTFDFYILLRIFIAGFGTHLYLKKINLSRQSALLGAIAYMFSGYFIQWITHWSLTVDMMIPYILFFIEEVLTNQNVKNTLFLGAVLGIAVLGGNPEAVIVVILFSLLYFLFRQKIKRFTPAALIAFLLSIGIAFLISLPFLWDTGLFFSQGSYSHSRQIQQLPIKNFEQTSFNERFNRTLQLLAPPSSFLEVARFGGLYQNNHFVLPYLGIFVLLLIIAAFSFWKRTDHHAFLLFFGGVIVFFIAKWLEIPLVEWVSALPILNQVIFLKYSSPFYFSAAILAAIGFENIKNENLSLKKLLSIALTLLFVFVLTFVFSSSFRHLYKLNFLELNPANWERINQELVKLPPPLSKAVRWLINDPYLYAKALFGFTLALFFVFGWLWWRKKYILILFFLVLELFIYIPKIRDGGFTSFNPYKEPPFIVYLKSLTDIDNYRIIATGETLLPQVATVYGLRDFRTFDGVMLWSYVHYVQPFLKEESYLRMLQCSCLRLGAEEIKPELLSSLGLASVKYIISEKGLSSSLSLKLIYDREVKIYENPGALPIVYLKYRDRETIGPAAILNYEPNQVKIKVKAIEDGILVFNETVYPGWRVFVDGGEKELAVLNGVFRAVHLQRGEHEVVFRYQPLFTRETFSALWRRGREE